MLILVTGGSGSGKSAFAESRVLSLPEKPRIYLATMMIRDEESRDRIRRHRKLREGKDFQTAECPYGSFHADRFAGCVVLLEDLSNLLANEMFSRSDPSHALQRVWGELEQLRRKTAHLVVVTNDVFSDGLQYTKETEEYLRGLGMLNCRLAFMADEVYEIVYGIPVMLKTPDQKSLQGAPV